MTTLKKHLSQERLNRIHRAWARMKPWQRAWILLRALWWASPGIHALVRAIRARWEMRITHILYPAHWIGYVS